MQLHTAKRCLQRFANAEIIHYWEYRAWLNSTPESEFNVLRFKDDQESVDKVSEFLDRCLGNLEARQRQGIERPVFAPVRMADTWAPRLEAG